TRRARHRLAGAPSPSRCRRTRSRSGQTNAPTANLLRAHPRMRSCCLACELRLQRAKQRQAVGRAEHGFAGTLGMRHQTEHVFLAVVDARDRFERAVDGGLDTDATLRVAVTKRDLI